MFQKSSDKKRGASWTDWSGRHPLIIRQWHQGSSILACWFTRPETSKPHQPHHQTKPTHTHIEEEDPTNLQELGMNLSGSQDKPTLALTIPRSNQVVYKGFPSATQFLSIQALRCGPLPNRNAFSTQVMIRTRPKTRLLSNPITQPTTFRRSIQRGFRLRGVQPLSHA